MTDNRNMTTAIVYECQGHPGDTLAGLTHAHDEAGEAIYGIRSATKLYAQCTGVGCEITAHKGLRDRRHTPTPIPGLKRRRPRRLKITPWIDSETGEVMGE